MAACTACGYDIKGGMSRCPICRTLTLPVEEEPSKGFSFTTFAIIFLVFLSVLYAINHWDEFIDAWNDNDNYPGDGHFPGH